VPGSKSQTNRALVLSALAAAGGVSSISGALRSRDTDLMIGALGALGLRVEGPEPQLSVSGQIAPRPDTRVDCGLGRHRAAICAAAGRAGHATATFDGGERARARPITPLLAALRRLGVDVDGDGLPFQVHGAGSVGGGTVRITGWPTAGIQPADAIMGILQQLNSTVNQ
jgi:3-phosphoshikimate 1-carboxyvinyltransferase